MGREASFTYEEVAAAADAVKRSGSKPTSRGIRERLGNVGSMGTINKMLQRWKANQDFMSAPTLVLPAPLQRTMVEFIEQEVVKVRSVLESEIVEYQHEMSDLANENERQAEVIVALENELQRVAEEKANAEGKAAQLNDDLEIVRKECANERVIAETLRTSLVRAELRLENIPRIEAELLEVRVSLSTERKARVAAEQAAAVSMAQKVDLDARVVDLKGQISSAAEQIVRVQEREARVRAEKEAAVLAAQGK